MSGEDITVSKENETHFSINFPRKKSAATEAKYEFTGILEKLNFPSVNFSKPAPSLRPDFCRSVEFEKNSRISSLVVSTSP